MDCNTATNNYLHHHHHHRQQNHHLNNNNTNCNSANNETLTPVLAPKDVSDCQVVIPLQFPNPYREFISDNRVCELNRYKYYHHQLQNSTTPAAPAQHSAIGNYDGKVLEGFSGKMKEPQSNGLSDLMDSARTPPPSVAAGSSVQMTMDIVDNSRLSLQQQQQQLQSDGAIFMDCHNNPLAKYHDIDGHSRNPAKYHMEANIYVCGSQDGGAGGVFGRTEQEFGEDSIQLFNNNL